MKRFLNRLRCTQFRSAYPTPVTRHRAERPARSLARALGTAGNANEPPDLFYSIGQRNGETPEKANPTSGSREQKQCEQ